MDTTELERLARDRPQVTRELHLPSAFYGHAGALRRYAGLPAGSRPKVAIEHGVGFTDAVWDVDLTARVPTFLCASAQRAARYAGVASPDRVAIPIGPMILYAEPPPEPPPGRRRLVAFPAHSTHHVDAVYDVERFAARLERERHEWDEIQVCIYWKDVLRGAQRSYEARGFDCVTAGHIYDSAFLGRLRAVLTGATAVISNEVGSFLFYAVALGRPVWLVDDEVDYTAGSAAILRRDRADRSQWDEQARLIRAAFAGRPAAVTGAQRALVERLAGLSEHRSPPEMAMLLTEAEQRYRHWAPPLVRLRRQARVEAEWALASLRSLRRGG